MKKKILVSSGNHTLLSDFFRNEHDELVFMSTSEFWDDVKEHVMVWQPDAYVCLIEEKSSLQLSIIQNMANSLKMSNIPVVIITNEDFQPFFAGGLYDNVSLILCKPISITNIYNQLTDMLRQIERERKLEEERKRVLEELKEKQKQQEEEVAQAEVEKNRVKNILVVDDDKDVLKLLKAVLQEKYNVSTMITGKMAEKFLETRPCDLILLDYEMPVENGPAVFKKIKNMESAKDIPIIFLTGVADKEKITEVLMLKPQGYLLKPIDTDKLLNTIENIVNS